MKPSLFKIHDLGYNTKNFVKGGNIDYVNNKNPFNNIFEGSSEYGVINPYKYDVNPFSIYEDAPNAIDYYNMDEVKHVDKKQRKGKYIDDATLIPSDIRPEVISKEETSYNNKIGSLVVRSDGSLSFKTLSETEGDELFKTERYNFNNLDDYNAQKPSQVIIDTVTKDYQKYSEVINYDNGKKSTEELYHNGILEAVATFHDNGEYDTIAILDEFGNIIDVRKFDENGKEISLVEDETSKEISNDDENPSIDNIDNRPRTDEIDNTREVDNGSRTGEVDNKSQDNQQYSLGLDGIFGNSAQIEQGDCYLLSSINAIRQAKDGQQILKNLVKVSTGSDGKKSYTVTFPGAKIAADTLKNDPRIRANSVAITGTYTFSEDELRNILAQAGTRYSQGDPDVILLEAAFEKYRQEVLTTKDRNPMVAADDDIFSSGLQTGDERGNILSGGFPNDALFILTGKKSEVYSPSNNNQAALSFDDLKNNVARFENTSRYLGAGASNLDNQVLSTQRELNNLLDRMSADSNDGNMDCPATAGFKISGDSGHAFTIKSVTSSQVILINPWFPDKDLVMDRQDFLRNAIYVSYTNNQPSQADNYRLAA